MHAALARCAMAGLDHSTAPGPPLREASNHDDPRCDAAQIWAISVAPRWMTVADLCCWYSAPKVMPTQRKRSPR
jgi:hypothetical protein